MSFLRSAAASRSAALAVPLLLASTLYAQATPKQAAAILKAAEDSKVADHLDHLVNRIGPRLTSSDNLTNACEWAREQFAKMGLEARVEPWGEYKVGFNRGPWSGRMLKPEQLEFTFNTHSWTAGTKGKVQGKLLPWPAEEDEVEELGDKAKGAWFLRRGRRGAAVLRALRDAGAAGVINRSRDLLITGGRPPANFASLPEMPSVNMLPAQYRKLADLLEDDKEVEVEFDIRNYFKKGPIPVSNVIAELKGSKFPNEYVIVGGHIDSWDGATGTTDNGTGVATTMEAARLITAAGIKPLRTIRFMLWSGEEQGLRGSNAYAGDHPKELPNISAVLVHDGGTNRVAGIAALEAMIPALTKALAPIENAQLKFPFKIRTIDGFTPVGSDHESYLKRGVPGFFWMQAGKANYTYTHHTQHDTYDSAIQEYQEHSSKVIALAAVGIANLPKKLSREGFRFGRRGGGRRLGINTEEDGVTVTRVARGSTASRAGIKAGDKVLKIGKMEVKSQRQLRRAIRGAKLKTKIKVKRKGKTLTLDATFRS